MAVMKQLSKRAGLRSPAKRPKAYKRSMPATGVSSGKNSDASSEGNIIKQDDPIGTATVTSSSLNVRNGAGTNYQRIGGLTKGKTISVYEEKDDWIRIGYGTGYGWVCAKYTTYKPKTDTKPESGKTIITTDDLYLRDEPSTSGNALALMPVGTKLEVLDEKNGWYQVKYNGQTGWCCGDYTMVYDPSQFAGSGKPAEAVKYAATFLGQKTKDLLGVLPYLSDLSSVPGSNNGYDLNCANFVSAILQNFGLIGSHQNNEEYLAKACLDFGYQKVDKSQTKPGDVYVGNGHTELVESNDGSTVTMIGSNNPNGGNVQVITRDSYSAQHVSSARYYSLYK